MFAAIGNHVERLNRERLRTVNRTSYAFRSRHGSPVAERLVFMAVEDAARHVQDLSFDQKNGREELEERTGAVDAGGGRMDRPAVRGAYPEWLPGLVADDWPDDVSGGSHAEPLF